MCRRSKRFSIAGRRPIGVRGENNTPRAGGNRRAKWRESLIPTNGAARPHSANMQGGDPACLRVLFVHARDRAIPRSTQSLSPKATFPTITCCGPLSDWLIPVIVQWRLRRADLLRPRLDGGLRKFCQNS